MNTIASISDEMVRDFSSVLEHWGAMTAFSATATESSDANHRANVRTHLFLSAILSSGAVPTPIRIRNLSTSGALVEGLALPSPGSPVLVQRGRLSVEGTVAWKLRNQAGIAFNSKIFVSSWLPPKQGSRQCAIDRMVFEAKVGVATESSRPVPLQRPDGPTSESAELRSLRNELVALGHALVGDADLVALHPEIQVLDIAVQRLDRLLTLAAERDTPLARRQV